MIIDLKDTDELFAALGVPPVLIDEYRNQDGKGRALVRGLKSSYSENNFDEMFYGLARFWKPELYLELGVLSGYSLLSTSLALQKNAHGKARGVDLFEEYEFNKDYLAAVQGRISALHLADICSLTQGSVFDLVPEAIRPDVLHIDLSNNGDLVKKLFETWRGSVRQAILFEGGGHARDQVEWMKKFNKSPMRPVFEGLSEDKGLSVYQIQSFPTLTVVLLDRV